MSGYYKCPDCGQYHFSVPKGTAEKVKALEEQAQNCPSKPLGKRQSLTARFPKLTVHHGPAGSDLPSDDDAMVD